MLNMLPSGVTRRRDRGGGGDHPGGYTLMKVDFFAAEFTQKIGQTITWKAEGVGVDH